ncbi:MAG TPA: serine hydrolase [Thermoanaerobaculia bacterium]|nr:serine hydrolase [Thermoanaerobaculia bacterium]
MLRQRIDDIAAEAGARAVAVSFYDWETETAWSLRGGRWFHAASTMKLGVLVGLAQAVAAGRLDLDGWLHVRNRFASRLDGEPFRVQRDRDSDGAVHAEIGKLMRIRDLAERMIVASSNLATNLLLDLLGVPETRAVLAELGLTGLELVRGVEDQRAHEAGIDNRATADGLLALLQLLHEPGPIAGEPARHMVEVLGRQELTGGVQLALPEALRGRARVAHKTGEISTVAHDAGLVFFPDRRPFALVLMSEWPPGSESHQAALGRIGEAALQELVAVPASATLPAEAPQEAAP